MKLFCTKFWAGAFCVLLWVLLLFVPPKNVYEITSRSQNPQEKKKLDNINGLVLVNKSFKKIVFMRKNCTALLRKSTVNILKLYCYPFPLPFYVACGQSNVN